MYLERKKMIDAARRNNGDNGNNGEAGKLTCISRRESGNWLYAGYFIDKRSWQNLMTQCHR